MSQVLENRKPKMISLDILNKVSKSICKLIITNGDEEWTEKTSPFQIVQKNLYFQDCL